MPVKLTKSELKNQKDNLKQFRRYLPTLQLKKQQLQSVVMQKNEEITALEKQKVAMIGNLNDWVCVFNENKLFDPKNNISNLIKPKSVIFDNENIAGVNIPTFKELSFEDITYNVENYPLWVDTALIKIREIAKFDALIYTLKKQIDLLEKELRSTSQRVNLFEKVKIPEAKENIRVIGIYLGDQQTSAVVRGKIAKKKLAEAKR